MYNQSPARRVKTVRSPANGRGAHCLVHLSKGWTPAHPEHLRKVRQIDLSLPGSAARAAAVSEISKDPGLLLYAVRNLKTSEPLSPLKALREIEEWQLREIIDADEKKISPFKWSDCSPSQSKSYQYTFLATEFARALAPHWHLDQDKAVGATFMSRVAWNLIAWNYPNIYGRAFTKHGCHSRDLELELTRLLKVRPEQVAGAFGERWGICKELLPSSGASDRPEAAMSNEKGLAALCEASRRFASAHEEGAQPEAAAWWAKHGQPLAELIGHGPIDEICNAAKQQSERRARKMPGNEQGRESERAISDSTRDPSIKRLPVYLQERFVELHRRIVAGQVSVEALKVLVGSIVPSLGFEFGCLYLLSKTDFRLMPALRIGSRPLSDYNGGFNRSVISAALYGHAPYKGEGIGVDGDWRVHVCGPLRSQIHPGVLYLETKKSTLPANEDFLVCFNALNYSFAACLGEVSP